MKALAVLAILAAAVSADYFSYDGYKVYRVVPTNEHHIEVLKIFKENEEFDFWTNARSLGKPISIMVKPEHQDVFVKKLNENDIQYQILINNVESTIQAERTEQRQSPKIERGRISFTEYHRYDIIQEYLERLAEEYPKKANVSTFGTSYEGRPLRYIQIGDNPNNPTIVMDGGIHAREWIGPAMALYIIQQLVENEEYEYLSENVNWIIVPVFNPDGYEYTHTDMRMWRKTRRSGDVCDGVDANRNFGYMWGGLGSSSNECSIVFRGPYAYSEPEVASFRDLVLGLKNVELYIALHSFGQYVIYPWGYDYILPDDVDEVHYLGEVIAEAIKETFGTSYSVGSSAILLGAAAGCSDDWMKGEVGVAFSYTLELPGGGSQGFDLPPSGIQDVVVETWPGILAGYNYIINRSEKDMM